MEAETYGAEDIIKIYYNIYKLHEILDENR